MKKIIFILVCEGSSDKGLVPHLEHLCVQAGADEATGIAPNFSALPNRPAKDVSSQVQAALTLEPDIDLIFIHRDSDSPDAKPRHEEIEFAMQPHSSMPFVKVVPIQELEAWLLLDETEIRRVSGKPKGKLPLGLPTLKHTEQTTSPKEILQNALLTASDLKGRRRKKFRQNFPKQRAILLERLNINGPIKSLSAWKRLTNDIQKTLSLILEEED